MAKPAPTFYIFHGQDHLGRDEQLAKFKAQLGDPSVAAMNISTFDGSKVVLADVASACATMPFMSDRRLVIIEGLLETAAGKAQVDALKELIPTLPDWTRLVLVEDKKLPKNNTLLRFANQHESARVVLFDAPRNATGWIVKRAARHDATIEASAANLLAELIGNNLRLADSEIAKLAAYTGGQRAINRDDIILLTPYSAEINIFKMVDALGQRNEAQATHLLQGLLANAPNMGDLLGLFGMIVRQFRLLIMVREYIDNGSGGNIADDLDLNSFVADKMSQQARNFTLPQLEETYHHLLETDMAIKTGRIDTRLALEVLVAELAGQ